MTEESAIDQMLHVNVEQAVNTIRVLDTKTPKMLWGEPGCGKTRTILFEFEEKEGYIVIPVLAGQSEPTDIQGIPFNHQEIFAKYLMPYWGFAASNHPDVQKYCMTPDGCMVERRQGVKGKRLDGPMVLFFDDLPTAHEQTQAAFFKVVDEKHLGEFRIRDNVQIIAAGNRIDDLSATTEMPYALRNRFLHLYVKPDVDTWMTWASKAGVHPHVRYYLRRNHIHLSTFEDAKDSAASAFATPRMWEMLSRALFSLEEAGLRQYQTKSDKSFTERKLKHDHEYVVVQGCIGTLATQFLVSIKSEYSVIPPEDIIKDPKKCEVPDITEVDRLYATVTNLEHWFMDRKHHKHYEAYLIYALRLPNEFGLLLARQFITVLTENMSNEQKAKVIESTIFEKMMDKWQEKLDINFE